MRFLSFFTLVLGALLLAGVPGQAATITYTATGSFNSDAPSSWFSAPGETFRIEFTVDQNPALVFPAGGQSFSPSITDFHYSLNGVDLNAMQLGMYFYTAPASSGMFSVAFAPAVDRNGRSAIMYFSGPQMFSGAPASPTMVTGTFQGIADPDAWLYVNGRYAGTSPIANATGVITGAVPEPASWALVASPLLVLWLRFRSRQA